MTIQTHPQPAAAAAVFPSGPRRVAGRTRRWGAAATLALVFAVWAGPAGAQSMEERLRSQLRATSQQLSTLQSQQAQLTAAKTAAEAARDAALAENKQLAAELAKTKGYAETLAGRQATVQENARDAVQASQEQVTKFRAAYDELLELARGKESQRATLHASLTKRDAQLATCSAKNTEMYGIAKDILSAYESISTGDLLAIRQPFSGSARVKFDMLAQEYGDKLYATQYDERQRPPAAPGDAPPATAPAPADAAPAAP